MDEKQKALEQVLNQIEKQYGKGAIMKLGSGAADISVEALNPSPPSSPTSAVKIYIQVKPPLTEAPARASNSPAIVLLHALSI